jgi:RNA polymerase sigma factor (TIGR02999 family)
MEVQRAPDITRLLVAWGNGDKAALDALAPHVQHELHRLAVRYMAAERPGHMLQATALVNEAYLRLVDWKDVKWNDRAHFFGVAALMMRRVLVDCAREKQRAKRGGEAIQVSISLAADAPEMQSADMIALDDALQELERLDQRQSRVVEMRFFGGLSLEETAEALNVSVGTVRRDWNLARAWLFRELRKKDAG